VLGLRTNVVENGVKKAVLTPATGYGTTIVGGAMGAGVLLGLDRTQLLNCFGIAGYMAPVPALGKYLRLAYSPTAKYTSAGWVAMGSVLATRLAMAGYTGDREVLDGEFGLWRMSASPTCNWDFMLGGIGTTWQIRNNEIKPYPSFRMGHPGIEAFLKLLDAENIPADSIERIDVSVDPVAASPIYLNREITSHSDAYISWSHVMGVAPYYQPGPAWQSKEAINDPRVKTLSDKVFVQGKWDRTAAADGASSTLVMHPVEVIVQANGKRYQADLMPYPKGHPKRPLTDAEFDAKFLHNASWRFSEAHARELLSTLKSLADLKNLRPLFAAIRAQ
jgi:2-methylcitrate dehydratase PrpD